MLLFSGTFLLILFFTDYLKNSRYFPVKVRGLISSFAIVLSIGIMTVWSVAYALPVPTLIMPTNMLTPSLPSRASWLVRPLSGIPVWVAGVAILPGLLFSILIFMEQQITTVIVNNPDNKLRKGFGYHLDLFVLALYLLACSALGVPFYSAAAILSMTHVQSLRVESCNAAPGERPLFLGIREQRVSALIAALLLALSLLLAPLINTVPTPILFGVFLYMGYSTLSSQLIDRILLLLMPRKYQPDYSFLRLVPLSRVHMFTLIQTLCLAVLVIVKQIPVTSMLFPLVIIVIMGIRKRLEAHFMQKELLALDQPLPTWRQLNGRVASADVELANTPTPPPPTPGPSTPQSPSSPAVVFSFDQDIEHRLQHLQER